MFSDASHFYCDVSVWVAHFVMNFNFHSWDQVCLGRETDRAENLRTYVDIRHPVPLRHLYSCSLGQVDQNWILYNVQAILQEEQQRSSCGGAFARGSVHCTYRRCTAIICVVPSLLAINPGAVYVVQAAPCPCPQGSTCSMLL